MFSSEDDSPYVPDRASILRTTASRASGPSMGARAACQSYADASSVHRDLTNQIVDANTRHADYILLRTTKTYYVHVLAAILQIYL